MKRQLLLIISTMITTAGIAQAVLADVGDNDTDASVNIMNQELSAIPARSLLIFNSDYMVNMMEDFSFTPACHFEPGMPTGSDVTPAGTVFEMGVAQEIIKRDGEIKIAITGKSADGREVLVHCDKTNLSLELLDADLHEKGLSIISVKKGLKETANIDLVIKQSSEAADIYFERIQIHGSL